MKALTISMVLVLGMLACSEASAVAIRVGRVAIRTRPAVRRPVARPVVAPRPVYAPRPVIAAPAPVLAPTPASVRSTIRAQRYAAWQAYLESLGN